MCESLIKKTAGVWALGWLVSIAKAHSQGNCLLYLGISWPQGGWGEGTGEAVSPGSRPQMPEHQEYRN